MNIIAGAPRRDCTQFIPYVPVSITITRFIIPT
jgi:hypothetical protein